MAEQRCPVFPHREELSNKGSRVLREEIEGEGQKSARKCTTLNSMESRKGKLGRRWKETAASIVAQWWGWWMEGRDAMLLGKGKQGAPSPHYCSRAAVLTAGEFHRAHQFLDPQWGPSPHLESKLGNHHCWTHSSLITPVSQTGSWSLDAVKAFCQVSTSQGRK